MTRFEDLVQDEKDLVTSFFRLAKNKNWFNPPEDSEDFAELKVDEILFDDFHDYYKNHENEGIDYREIEQDYRNEIMKGL